MLVCVLLCLACTSCLGLEPCFAALLAPLSCKLLVLLCWFLGKAFLANFLPTVSGLLFAQMAASSGCPLLGCQLLPTLSPEILFSPSCPTSVPLPVNHVSYCTSLPWYWHALHRGVCSHVFSFSVWLPNPPMHWYYSAMPTSASYLAPRMGYMVLCPADMALHSLTDMPAVPQHTQ